MSAMVRWSKRTVAEGRHRALSVLKVSNRRSECGQQLAQLSLVGPIKLHGVVRAQARRQQREADITQPDRSWQMDHAERSFMDCERPAGFLLRLLSLRSRFPVAAASDLEHLSDVIGIGARGDQRV